MAHVAMAVGRDDVARHCVAMAIERNPAVAGFHNAQGLIAARSGDRRAAARSYRIGLALAPADASIWANLGSVHHGAGRMYEAVSAFGRGIASDPHVAALYLNRGAAYEGLRAFDAAEADCRASLALDPALAGCWMNLALIRQQHVDTEGAQVAARRATFAAPADHAALSARLLLQAYDPACDRGAGFAAHRDFAKLATRQVSDLRLSRSPVPGHPIRVGYVSGDFRDHAIASFIEPILRNHDRHRFMVFCYDARPSSDAVANRLRAIPAVCWRDISTIPTAGVIAQINADILDILVDLSGHTAFNRLDVFAQPGGPVKITMQGYPNTTGLPTVDYRLSDSWQDPIGDSDPFYSERIYRLPGSCWVFEPPPAELEPVRRSARDRLILGSIGEARKLNLYMLGLWADILRGLPDARLRFLATPEGAARGRIARVMQSRGLDSGRIEFVGRLAKAEYYQAIADIDLALDTFPYNGGTTTLEALWCGTPIVSLTGAPMVSRMGLGLLSAVGLGELAVADRRAYVDLVWGLAADRERLGGLRSTVRERLIRSPLTDSDKFVRRLEDAYLDMLASRGMPAATALV